MIAIMVLATFAVPMATLTFLWEMNTPRNVSVIEVIKLFVVGGGISVLVITLGYITPLFSAGEFYQAGILEESSKAAGGDPGNLGRSRRALSIPTERNSVWCDGGRGVCLL